MTHPSVNSIVERLEPCPFCGGEAKPISGGPGNWFIQCSSCRASTDDVGYERAIERWNTRPAATIISELQAQNERKDRLIEAHRQQIIDAGEIMKHWQDRALAAESSLSRIKAETIEAADRLVGNLWVDLFNRDLVKASGADYFDKWRERIRSLGSTGGAEKTAESDHSPSTPTTATE